jgi:mannitol/fructose-specific phosphotransferase system IIA component (Ntr-type)
MTTSTGASVLDSSLYIPELKSRRKRSVLQELVTQASQAGAVRSPALLLDTLLLRESLAPTSPGRGLAVPHARSVGVADARLVIGRSHRGIDWDAPDEMNVHLVLLVLSPAESGDDAHFDFVARVVAAARLQRSRQRILDAADFTAVASALGDLTP